MRFLSSLVFCFLCYSLSLASDTYRAATFGSSVFSDLRRYLPALKDASKHDVNIVVLPSGDIYTAENYDEDVKTLSDLAQQTNLYIVAHLLEKTQCPNGEEVVRSNLVFDKEGSIIAVYRKPMNNIANCTFTSKDVTTFTSDFGVTFGLLMEEDLVLRPPGLKGLKNFVVTGPSQADISFLNANQFAPSWAFINNVNLITSSAVYAGRSGKVEGQYVDLMKFIEKESNEAPLSSLSSSFTSDDITGFIIRPVDLNLSPGGYEETVCHESFCCQFYVKTKAGLKQPKMNYYLSTFSGIRSFDKSHDIGTQICSVFACHQLEKRSCSLGHSGNGTFKKMDLGNRLEIPVMKLTCARSLLRYIYMFFLIGLGLGCLSI
ncbi:vanin-like protein 3 isoform X2 [Amyelois transitella]|uniref:vanin-like protein 3 isoform X2 n=1 Tax=Amyelois transitella TaxID=680683 RepID=UPI00298F6696|nr:vanin-like protein 3 isoform X2 [Amyelois transitella]